MRTVCDRCLRALPQHWPACDYYPFTLYNLPKAPTKTPSTRTLATLYGYVAKVSGTNLNRWSSDYLYTAEIDLGNRDSIRVPIATKDYERLVNGLDHTVKITLELEEG